MDPIVFILWLFTAATMLLWNRGTFCGWLCPFGSLQELTNRIAKKLGVKQIIVVGIALTILLLVFLFQDWIVRYEKWYDRFRLAFLTFTLFYIG